MGEGGGGAYPAASITHFSCTLLKAPRRTAPRSPLSTEPCHTEHWSATSASPTSVALGAIHASAATLGVRLPSVISWRERSYSSSSTRLRPCAPRRARRANAPEAPVSRPINPPAGDPAAKARRGPDARVRALRSAMASLECGSSRRVAATSGRARGKCAMEGAGVRRNPRTGNRTGSSVHTLKIPDSRGSRCRKNLSSATVRRARCRACLRPSERSRRDVQWGRYSIAGCRRRRGRGRREFEQGRRERDVIRRRRSYAHRRLPGGLGVALSPRAPGRGRRDQWTLGG